MLTYEYVCSYNSICILPHHADSLVVNTHPLNGKRPYTLGTFPTTIPLNNNADLLRR